jgi:hypothetical protein
LRYRPSEVETAELTSGQSLQVERSSRDCQLLWPCYCAILSLSGYSLTQLSLTHIRVYPFPSLHIPHWTFCNSSSRIDPPDPCSSASSISLRDKLWQVHTRTISVYVSRGTERLIVLPSWLIVFKKTVHRVLAFSKLSVSETFLFPSSEKRIR